MQQRLFEIVWALTRQGGATAGQLAERFGVSRRTIYRDIDALSSAGIPVYAEKGKGGGIRLLPDFVVDKTLFTQEEQTQLLGHMESLATLGTPDVDGVLDKLGALFGRRESWLEVDFAPWDGGEDTRALFRLLRQAILGHRVVIFSYYGASGACTQRRVEPLRIVFKGQAWYLQAFCQSRGAVRFFKLNRIQNAALAAESFEPRALPEEDAAAPTQPNVRVQLKLGPKLAHRALDEFAPAQRTPTDDGGFVVECDFPAGAWLMGYLLSYGPDAEVLAPDLLRRQLKGRLKEMLRKYD